jgi:hypothetical protein
MRAPIAITFSCALMAHTNTAQALDEVAFGTNWKAQAEHVFPGRS